MTLSIPTTEGFSLEGVLSSPLGPAVDADGRSPSSATPALPTAAPVLAPTVASAGERAGRLGVVICHPHPAFGGTMQTPLVVSLAEAAAAAGIVALRFNFRGIGSSGGRATGGTEEHRDVAAAVGWLRQHLNVSSVGIVGYSFGALMAARALGNGLTASAFVAIALPTAIIGDHADRIAHVRAGLRCCPSLALSGTQDSLSDVTRLRDYCAGAPAADVVALEGEGHFFHGATATTLAARAAAFVLRRGV